MRDTSLIRLLLWLPAIFLASYLAVGAAFAVAIWLWPWGYLAIAGLVGLLLLAAHVS